jgi:putative ABC transport system substrate-binding protein
MNRRETTLALLLSAGSALTGRAQSPSRVPRVGVLGVDLASAPRPVAAFRERLRVLGYVEGRNVEVVYRSAEGNRDRLPGLAAEFAARPVDVIVATGGVPAADAARKATTRIPIVFVAVGDPVKAGFVESLARPGGNLTGLTSVFPDLIAKVLQLVHETLPRATRVTLLADGNLPSASVSVSKAEVAARAMNMRVDEKTIAGPEDFERAFAEMSKAGADAVFVFGSPMILAQRQRLVAAAARSRMPTVYALREYVEAGGLMSYGPDLSAMFVGAAGYVDSILKGARPGDLPVQAPTRLELVINATTAAALGIAIPQSVLLQAGPDGVIR